MEHCFENFLQEPYIYIYFVFFSNYGYINLNPVKASVAFQTRPGDLVELDPTGRRNNIPACFFVHNKTVKLF